MKLFQLTDRFFNENDIMWNNCIGLCTDGAQSMAGHKTDLQTLVKMRTPEGSLDELHAPQSSSRIKSYKRATSQCFAKVTRKL